MAFWENLFMSLHKQKKSQASTEDSVAVAVQAASLKHTFGLDLAALLFGNLHKCG